tara:strand:- start:1573 stop:2823 length:1251 start_codon:yes stop_codon:yes gene_type:complete
VKRFTQFVEAKESTAVFTFGRFNPPTIGHQKLLQAVQKVARQKSGKTFIFGSFSQDKKKNPLSHQQKMKYLKQMFPNEMRGNKPVSGLRTAIEVAVYLNSYDNLVMVVGSDRVSEFQKLLDTYNGVEARHGMYSFKKIEVVSAGDRDPDAEGVTGMSASKMRAAAASGDMDSFQKGLPAGYDGTELFNDVRKGMGIQREIKSFKPVSEMDNMEWVREQYFQNMIYEIGEWVRDKKTGIVGEVVKRGTNYVTVVQEDFSLHKIWLEDLETTEKKKTKLPEAVDFLKNRNLWEKYRREAYEFGSPEFSKYLKKLTPGEKVKTTKESVQKLAVKFKIPMNVASAIYRKLVQAGLDPLKLQSYSAMLSTYMNLMDQKISEVAPPGKEKVVKALKKKWPDNLKRVYATAWYQYNKEKGKDD